MSLSDLVLSIADNKQMLGLRYAEWATRAPSLEADIAAAAMGLDDLGHNRVLYGCLEPLGSDPRGPERESTAVSIILVVRGNGQDDGTLFEAVSGGGYGQVG